jgi:hypothetical protein
MQKRRKGATGTEVEATLRAVSPGAGAANAAFQSGKYDLNTIVVITIDFVPRIKLDGAHSSLSPGCCGNTAVNRR